MVKATNQFSIGEKFSRWTIIDDAGMRGDTRYVLCECNCGTRRKVRLSCLLNSRTHSCGCAHGTHRQTKTPTYKSWCAMIARCCNPNADQYKHYGGRGIVVCERWRKSFTAFLADMGPRPGTNYSIERKEVNGNYEPSNCIWLLKALQLRNTRKSRFLEYNGTRLTQVEWAEKLGMNVTTIAQRLRYGWSVDKALGTPLLRQRRHKAGAIALAAGLPLTIPGLVDESIRRAEAKATK